MSKGKGGLIAAGLGALALLGFAMRGTAQATEAKKMDDVKPPAKKGLAMPSAQTLALAKKYSAAMGVPLDLVLTILRIESGFNANATNPKAVKQGGAWGMGQILFTTAQDLTKRFPASAKKFWPTWNGTAQGLLDPAVNIAMTCFTLWLSWDRYKEKPYADRWNYAALAHHQGRGGVDKLLTKGGGQIVESHIPPNGAIYWSRLKTHRWTEPTAQV